MKKTNKPYELTIVYDEIKSVDSAWKKLIDAGLTPVAPKKNLNNGSTYWQTRYGFIISETLAGNVIRMRNLGKNFSSQYYTVNPRIDNKVVKILSRKDRLLYILDYVTANEHKWSISHNRKVNKNIYLTTK
jgi:hypothetical protein